jgi:2-amino-4-hydroxy-6-hydroxymethyldihydropteridine diphosphokinase
MHNVFVGLGGNLGTEAEIRARFAAATDQLAVRAATGPVDRSPIYRSPPAGPVREQPDFLNQVIGFATSLEPRQLLAILRAIEDAHGRVRDVPKGPRTLDLDLLIHGELVVCEPDLVVPHPRLGLRPFVLAPLLDLLGGPPPRI